MTVQDATNRARCAQRLIVEGRRGYGSPPSYGSKWLPVWASKVDCIEINRNGTPSVATIWFPGLRWDQSSGLAWGDMIRIRTDEPYFSVIFVGFITSYLSDFSGGTAQDGSFERNGFVCHDHRWLLSITSPITGQISRSPDDYANYGTPSQAPVDYKYTYLSGRRAIFNADGKPNCDPSLLVFSSGCDIPIFGNSDVAVPWTAREMLAYILSPINNKAYDYLPIANPDNIVGLDHPDWDRVINNVAVDGLSAIEAVELICKHLGWGFRLDYGNKGSIDLVLYKIASTLAYNRNSADTTILHQLHAPAPGENIEDAIVGGRKMLWAMSLAEDISNVINNPWGLGAPDRFEITAELVPAWLDTDLTPDASDNYDYLYFTDSDLQYQTDPNSRDYYKYYHPRGRSFKRDVGRRWTLNETGRYSDETTYDRGMPFDFATVIPPEYIYDEDGKRKYAPFNRQLLPCLTLDKDSLNSVGIKVEFSFNGGSKWQVIPAAISSLDDECGIYIDEANLAELVDETEQTISDGDLDGVQLNLWTSLCRDKLAASSFKDGQWLTRCRITASVQMDRRLNRQSRPTFASGSPFDHRHLYDFSAKYKLQQRTDSSSLASSALPSDDTNDKKLLDSQLAAVRDANEDMSISGRFTLERLWLGDGSGTIDFMVGDSIERITGREYDLSAAVARGVVYPEIIKIIINPSTQKMQLVTRDLRYAEEVTL